MSDKRNRTNESAKYLLNAMKLGFCNNTKFRLKINLFTFRDHPYLLTKLL